MPRYSEFLLGAFISGAGTLIALEVLKPAADTVSLEKRNPITLPVNPNLTPGEFYSLKEHKFMNRTCYVASSGTGLGVSCYETKNESDAK